MLSRTADNLYWLGRHMERAENLSRILEVGDRMSVIPRGDEDPHTEWHSTLVISGTHELFYESHDTPDQQSVIEFLALDPSNPSSIRSCLETARRNARSVRTALTSEMWESLNSTWLDFTSDRMEQLRDGDLRGFLDWVRERSTIFRGAAYGTMLRTDRFYFLRMGTFIERADNTARILDVKYHVLMPKDETLGGSLDYSQWVALLRSVSAARSFHWIYREQLKPWLVAEFLVLREEMPRSLVSCLGEVNSYLERLAEVYGTRSECHRTAGEIYARLKYGRTDDIFRIGLHEYLTDFIERNNRLNDEIGRAYLT